MIMPVRFQLMFMFKVVVGFHDDENMDRDVER
jgi:hypothetical protein